MTAVAPPATARRRVTGTVKPPLRTAVRWTGRGLARGLLRLTVQGVEHVPAQGPVLLAGNHAGAVDGPLVFALSPRPVALLAKSELFVGPWARLGGWLGLIPVHRGAADRTALRSGLDHLAGGGALGVFPEGTRGSGGFDEISDGLAYLALRSGAPVVPIAVLGTEPARTPLPRLGAPVRVVFGPPVTVDPTGDPRARRTVRDAAEQLRLALLAHLQTSATEEPT